VTKRVLTGSQALVDGTQPMTRKAHTPLLPIVVLCAVGMATTQAETVTYFATDHLGSPVAAMDSSGSVIWRESYSPYGEKLEGPSGADNDTGYTGHQSDAATDLTYMQARYYDPVVGRFLAVDPVGFSDNNLIAFNSYSYVNNNSYKFTDPTGMAPDEEPESSSPRCVTFLGLCVTFVNYPPMIRSTNGDSDNSDEDSDGVAERNSNGTVGALATGLGQLAAATESSGRNLPISNSKQIPAMTYLNPKLRIGGGALSVYGVLQDRDLLEEGRISRGEFFLNSSVATYATFGGLSGATVGTVYFLHRTSVEFQIKLAGDCYMCVNAAYGFMH